MRFLVIYLALVPSCLQPDSKLMYNADTSHHTAPQVIVESKLIVTIDATIDRSGDVTESQNAVQVQKPFDGKLNLPQHEPKFTKMKMNLVKINTQTSVLDKKIDSVQEEAKLLKQDLVKLQNIKRNHRLR